MSGGQPLTGGGLTSPDLRGLSGIARFAECLACEWTIFEASRECGIDAAKGLKVLAQMRRDMGWQAK
jgi:hypothetical protein